MISTIVTQPGLPDSVPFKRWHAICCPVAVLGLKTITCDGFTITRASSITGPWQFGTGHSTKPVRDFNGFTCHERYLQLLGEGSLSPLSGDYITNPFSGRVEKVNL